MPSFRTQLPSPFNPKASASYCCPCPLNQIAHVLFLRLARVLSLSPSLSLHHFPFLLFDTPFPALSFIYVHNVRLFVKYIIIYLLLTDPSLNHNNDSFS